MYGNKRLQAELPHLFDANTNYTALRAITVHGVQLQPGDSLPADSPLRQNPKRLEILCRERALVATTALAPKPATEAVPQVVEESALDLSQMTGPQLMKACRERGLSPLGNKEQLRQRLRRVLG